MKLWKKTSLAFAMFLGSATLQAGAIITDGNVSLGVNDLASLNFGTGVADIAGETVVGMRYIDAGGTQYESTSHGCECEGWGVAATSGFTTVSGAANDSSGTFNLNLVSFTSDATTASSIVDLTGSTLRVTHDFALAAETDNLYRVTVTLENIAGDGGDAIDVRYRRTMDWDTSPTPFEEYVTIGGTAVATAVTAATDDGFCSSDPTASCGSIVTGGTGDFVALGPADHGANFDFNFGALAAGASYSFDIFYGGAADRTAALSALAAVGAEVYSLGWSGYDADQNGLHDITGAATPTFIFGFAGVGGVVVEDPTGETPVPATLFLLSFGLLGIRAAIRKQQS